MNYSEIIDYLKKQTKHNDVVLIKKALDAIALQIDPQKVIIVAGTNGKGTTCATLSTLLVEAGKNVGFFSSPHLKKINERIKFNNIDVSDEDFCNIFLHVHQRIMDYNLSYFEYLTLMAAYYFFSYVGETVVDFAIFEVGLGGTFDSTNAIPHDTCVITKLGCDHEDIFGSNMIEIAKNKFGIISENNLVFHLKFDTDVNSLSRLYEKKYSAKFIESLCYSLAVDVSGDEPIFCILTQFGDVNLNLPGKRAAENSMLAFTVFNYLIPDAQKYLYAIKKVKWPGRMEKIKWGSCSIFLSGDHNQQGIQSLLEILQYYKYEKIRFVVGICADKNHSAMLNDLFNFYNSEIYLTETPEKTLSIDGYDEQFLARAKYVSPDPIDALEAAIADCQFDKSIVVVTGSLYLVGLIRSEIIA